MSNVSLVGAWIWPGNKPNSTNGTSDVQTLMTDGRRIDFVSVQYYTVNSDGTLTQNTVANSGADGYSAANVAFLKAHTTYQFVTISGAKTGANALIASASLTTTFTNTLISFLQQNSLTGIELDFEIWIGGITSGQFSAYVTFVTNLGNALHNAGFKLIVTAPAISSSTQATYPNWLPASFNIPQVDYYQIMAYDHEYDTNGIQDPQAPTQWITDCCNYTQTKISSVNNIIVGFSAKGYSGKFTSAGAGTNYSITENLTYYQLSQIAGFSGATRDATSSGTPSQELQFTSGGTFYDFEDATTLQGHLNAAVATGIINFNTWFLGGNTPWYTNIPAAPSSTSSGGGASTGSGTSGSGGTSTGAASSAPVTKGDLSQSATFRNVQPIPVVLVDKNGNSISTGNPLGVNNGTTTTAPHAVNIQDPTNLANLMGVDSLGRITNKERTYALLENAQVFQAVPKPSANTSIVGGSANTNGAFHLFNPSNSGKSVVILGIRVLYVGANAVHCVNTVTSDQGFGGATQISNLKIGGAASVCTAEYANNGPANAGTPLDIIQTGTTNQGWIYDRAGLFLLPSGTANGIVVYVSITTAANWSVVVRWAEI